MGELPEGAGAEVWHGMLGRVWQAGARPDLDATPLPLPAPGPIRRDEVHERLCIITELERQSSRWRIVRVDGLLASPATRIERFTSTDRADRRR